MNTTKTLWYAFVVSMVLVTLGGCAKKEDDELKDSNAGTTSGQSSMEDSQLTQPAETTSQPSPPNRPIPAENVAGQDKEADMQEQIAEVRKAFLALQAICKANDMDGYVKAWDDETKMAVDGRNLSVEERRERRRKTLTEDPEVLQEIANATITSIAVDTSQAEKMKTVLGVQIEGPMMLVRTNGRRALLFHETARGWKLFTLAPPEYFR